MSSKPVVIQVKSSKSRVKPASKKQKQKKSQKTATRVVVQTPRARTAKTQMEGFTTRAATQIRQATQNPITLGLALPHLFPTPRFSDAYTGAPTAIANPFVVETANWTTPGYAEDPPLVPNGSFYAAASRSVLSHSVAWYNYPGEDAYYTCQFPVTSNQTFPTPFSSELRLPMPKIIATSDKVSQSVTYPINPHFSVATYWGSPGIFPHGYTYYNVDAGGRKGTWFTANQTISSTLPQFLIQVVRQATTHDSDTKGQAVVELLQWNGDTWDETRVSSRLNPFQLGDQARVSPSEPGYYAIQISIDYASGNTLDIDDFCDITVTTIEHGSQFGFRPLPLVEEVAVNIDGLRHTAASIMLSPHPSVLNLSGEVAGVQMPEGEMWYSPLLTSSSSPITAISNMSSAMTGPLKDGIYGFIKPASNRDFDMQQPFRIVDGEIVGYNNPISPAGGWLVVAATVPASDSSTYAGGLCYFTLASGVEFRTTNIWFSTQPAVSSADSFMQAVVALRNVEAWHENPWHIRDIMKSVMSAGKTALRLAPTIGSLISQFIPGMAPSKALLGSLSALGRAL